MSYFDEDVATNYVCAVDTRLATDITVTAGRLAGRPGGRVAADRRARTCWSVRVYWIVATNDADSAILTGPLACDRALSALDVVSV